MISLAPGVKVFSAVDMLVAGKFRGRLIGEEDVLPDGRVYFLIHSIIFIGDAILASDAVS